MPATERHFTPTEVAKMWGISAATVRRIFQDKPGVLLYGVGRIQSRARAYTTMRIPESILEREHQALTMRDWPKRRKK